MASVGSESNPMMFRKTIVNKDSRFRKGMNITQYKNNYDRIFNKHKTELDICREKSKTFSMDQE
jgi:hypothetical protein|tara:strand:+ start:495 stop:686 length:192 start_codon:yes stop_codon:yes gene_type:complete